MNRTPVIVLRRQQRLGAFTVIELLIAVVIIAVLTVISFQAARIIVRREKINSIALALAGYVEEVRNLSLKKVGSISAYSSNSSLKPCSISFVSSAAGNSLPAASVIASVSADTVDRSPAGLSINCAPRGNGTTTGLTGATDDGSFRVPYGLGSPVTVSVIQSGLSPSQQAKVTFTPRGLWAPALTSQTGDLIIKLLLENGGPMRCIRITDGLGFVDIGKSNSSSINATCDDYARF